MSDGKNGKRRSRNFYVDQIGGILKKELNFKHTKLTSLQEKIDGYFPVSGLGTDNHQRKTGSAVKLTIKNLIYVDIEHSFVRSGPAALAVLGRIVPAPLPTPFSSVPYSHQYLPSIFGCPNPAQLALREIRNY
ncbi:hypothetical protein EVAR_62080_1 [Eumeta japonica]|uniref:Uncharacterized protein n=1 Tax=Eumeta variegata TaxID=151549 RepID=A0A4C1Z366_EUMVA|nr:hypothetical protein EVAR_62080_1 [Eumeta japonica]